MLCVRVGLVIVIYDFSSAIALNRRYFIRAVWSAVGLRIERQFHRHLPDQHYCGESECNRINGLLAHFCTSFTRVTCSPWPMRNEIDEDDHILSVFCSVVTFSNWCYQFDILVFFFFFLSKTKKGWRSDFFPQKLFIFFFYFQNSIHSNNYSEWTNF